MPCLGSAFRKSLRFTALCTACVVLSACGGGGGAPADPPATIAQAGPPPAVSPGPGYFVDALNGSDANAGSFAAPWKSLAKLASVRLNAGESVYLRCGSVWRESLTLTASQLVDGAVITAYGSECNTANKPRITGAELFSGSWTKSGNIWRRSVSAGTPKIEQLFVNGAPMRTAQWPNYGGVGHEYAITAAGATASKTAITLSAGDAAALAGKDLTGAMVQIRTQPWFIEQRQVAALGAGSLALQSASEYAIDAGDGFVLQDKLWMLDAPGEFHHDAANGVLYVYPGDGATQADLNAAQVEGSVRSVGLVVSGRRNLTVSQLRVDMSTADGVALHTAVSAVLDGVDASNNLRVGIRVDLSPAPVAPAKGVTIRNGRYIGNGAAGIDAANVADAEILSNTVSATGTLQAAFTHSGIIGGDGARIDGNTIDQSAFRAIQFSGFGASAVTNNVISGYCLRLSDCAAVYTTNGDNRQGGNQTSSVAGNRIGAASLSVEGTVGGQILAGIYLDDLSRGVSVSNNLLMNMPVGIYVHNSSNSSIQSNRVWMTSAAGLMANMSNATADVMTGNVFSGNQIIPAASVAGTFPALPQVSTAQAIRFWHALHGAGSLSSGSNVFRSNQIVAFYDDTSVMAAVGHSADEAWLSAAAWRTLNPSESTPSSPAYYAIYKPVLGAELLEGGSFSGGLGGWHSWFAAAGVGGSLGIVNGISGCGTDCAVFSAGLAGDRLSSPNFNMVVGTPYMISFKASFMGSTSIAHPDIARPATPYESYVAPPGLRSRNITMSGTSGDTLQYEAFFTANSSDAARLNLRVGDPRVPVAFGSISLRPVTGYAISNFADWGAVVSAPATGGRTLACSDLGWAAGCSVVDVHGSNVPMPVTLAANEVRLLLWANSSWRQ
jgi:parallel beta-helix repeat protein